MFYFLEPQSIFLDDRLAERMFGTSPNASRKAAYSLFGSNDNMHRHSSYSLVETPKAYKISVNLPEVSSEDIHVKYNDGSLSIETKDANFSKTLAVDPERVDVDNIKANLNEAVLEVTAPKPEPRKVIVLSADPAPATGDSYTTTVDLPGIKLDDLTVTVRENHILSIEGVRHSSATVKKHKVAKKISIDTDVFDVSQVQACLNEGVLHISVPRKPEATTMEVKVTNVDHEEPENKDSAFQVSMDLPGVKVSDVSIKVKDNVLNVTAYRNYSNKKKVRMAKHFHLGPLVERSNIQANLLDGVLTVTAPRHSLPAPRTIPVTSNKTNDDPTWEANL